MKFVALLPEPDAHMLLVVHVVNKVIPLVGDTPSNFQQNHDSVTAAIKSPLTLRCAITSGAT